MARHERLNNLIISVALPSNSACGETFLKPDTTAEAGTAVQSFATDVNRRCITTGIG